MECVIRVFVKYWYIWVNLKNYYANWKNFVSKGYILSDSDNMNIHSMQIYRRTKD